MKPDSDASKQARAAYRAASNQACAAYDAAVTQEYAAYHAALGFPSSTG